ncbi:MAG: alpha/beta fold hydrolase [Anaerolineae bacterium]|nr:alpha/beta hydrolase [Anaerolineae bacterium]MDW8298947.1 alpha/beta fold hydrolase [Anaerolineae bacterium]
MFRRLAVLLAFCALLAVPLPSASAQSKPLRLENCEIPIGAQGATKQAAQCGVLSVPEDYSAPNGRQIEIHFAVLPARNAAVRREPIFHFEGGPGASAIEYYGLAWYSAYADLNEVHDIVLIDQRGTGKSASLQCTEIADLSFEDLKYDLDVKAEIAENIERVQACLARLSQTNDPRHYTTANLARDTDAVRAALGYDKINLFGSSYGSWLAQFYLRDFGERVHAAVLEGTVGPWDRPFLLANLHADVSLRRLFDTCAADAECKRAFPDLEQKLEQAVKRLRTAVRVSGTSSLTGRSYPVVINATRFLAAIRSMLYQGSLIGSVPQAIAQAANGNYTLPAAVLIAAAEQPISYGMNLSVVCAESVPFYTADLLAAIPDSTYFSALPNDTYSELCAAWRSAELDESEIAPVSSNVPTLFLAGDFDPITPTAFALTARARFPNSVLARFPYQGHTILPNSLCAQRLVRAFYANPSQLDTSCTGQDVPFAFADAQRLTYENLTTPTFRARIPASWSFIDERNGMYFFRSPDSIPEFLGIATYRLAGGAPLQRAAFEAISARYERLFEQARISQLGVTIVQYTFNTDQEVYLGGLITFGFGTQSRAVWYAAPANRFTARFGSLAVEVFGSVIPR